MPDPNPPDLWALLVGIDQYASPSLNDLGGCVNDIVAVGAFLSDRLGVPKARILTLTDGAATRAGIIQGFRTHLIDNPEVAPGSQLLFMYSGHGSQMATLDVRELDGYNETLVPADARTVDPATGQKVRDLPDKTLAALIDRLAEAKGDRITVILDCCHSGSGTRDPEGPGAVGVRRAAPDDDPAPADLDADLVGAPGGGVGGEPVSRGAGPSGWAAGGVNHVLLSGCRDGELSFEYRGPEGVQHGAMTYFLLQELQALRPETRYADLHERVAAKVNGIFRNQLPQCEGDRSRAVFGGARLEADPFVPVAEVQGQRVRLAAGLVHGLGPGTRLAVYPSEVRHRAELAGATRLATVKVEQVGATSAWAVVEPADGAGAAVPVHARAVVTERGFDGIAQTVAVEGLDAAMGAETEALRAAIAASPYLGPALEGAPADLRVQAREGRFHVYGQGGDLLVDPAVPGGEAARAIGALEVIARARALQDLRNKAASLVQGAVGLRLRRFSAAANPADMTPVEPDAGGELTLTYVPGAAGDENRYVLEVANRSPLALFPHVFYLGTDYSIVPLYPLHGEVEAIPAGRSGFPRRMGANAALFRLTLAEGEAASRDRIKVILTVGPANLALLKQDGVAAGIDRGATRSVPTSALERLVDALGGGEGMRGAEPDTLAPGEDWGVAELALNVVRAAASREVPATGAPVALGHGLTLTAPAGVGGRVTLRTAGEATRGDATPAVAPPPGLREPEAALQPVTLEANRGAGGGGLVIDLELDDAARSRVGPAAPVTVSLPAEAVAGASGLLAIAFDGEDYLPAGVSAADDVARLEITSLPEPTAPGGPAETRGLGNLVRFFVYKQLGRHTDELGLRAVALGPDRRPALGADGKPVYTAPQRDQIQPGQRVAVVVHGFSDDTRGLVRGLAAWLQSGPAPYDHVLAFDYETFGTGVARNGEDLALALSQRCGLGPDDQATVHVFAHSMGCLVTRCMVELSGGHEFVDRVVLAGPPNHGTTLATVSRGLTFLAALLLNKLAEATPVALLSLPLDQLREQGQGWGDLEVDSEVTRRLNGLAAPDEVPYLVLAGTNSAVAGTGADGDRARRLAAKTLDRSLDALFGEQNDVVIGLSSMRGMRNGAYPRLTVVELPCDHFTYFWADTGGKAIREWLG
jgi:hypothetical protein